MLHHRTPDTKSPTDGTVIDDQGREVGKVVETVCDGSDGDPGFLIVDPGRYRSCHYVPIAGSHANLCGEVVVPFAKWWVMCSPKASKGRLISPKTHAQLEAHYGPLYDWRRDIPDSLSL